MVRVLAAVMMLAAASASASPAIPSFEFSAAQLQSSIAAMRGEQLKKKAGELGPKISTLARTLQHDERETERLRSDLSFLESRLRRYQRPPAGRPDADPNLRWDVQRFTRDLSRLTRNAEWRLSDLRFLSAQAQKDQSLVAPATSLLSAARWLQNETNWFAMDARFAVHDFRRAGFTFEAMDLERDGRDLDLHAQELLDDADALLTKVRP